MRKTAAKAAKPTEPVVPSKTCTLCKKTFPLTEFYNDPQSKDGKAWRDKKCANATRKAAYWRQKHNRQRSVELGLLTP